ncbi:hypothetical protein PLICRDRAFT_492961 [Plicaturopsis crispa FD-325 SS-3]|nr:hypothetical protein PLICRDRAFT_492961 [Plicaturopsis crispa FD-325 SS-3]
MCDNFPLLLRLIKRDAQMFRTPNAHCASMLSLTNAITVLSLVLGSHARTTRTGSRRGGLARGIIAAIIVPIIVGLALCLCCIFAFRRRRARQNMQPQANAGPMAFLHPGQTQPASQYPNSNPVTSHAPGQSGGAQAEPYGAPSYPPPHNAQPPPPGYKTDVPGSAYPDQAGAGSFAPPPGPPPSAHHPPETGHFVGGFRDNNV